MTETITINLQIDPDLKSQTEEILDGLGLTFSEAFALMLQHVRLRQTLPFDTDDYSCTFNSKTLSLIERIENGEEEMSPVFDTYEEFQAWIEEGDDDD